MEDGIETTRPVKSIHQIPERLLSKERLRSLMDQGDGIFEANKIESAEKIFAKQFVDF